MASLIEELRKLPAKVRISKLKELRKRLLWVTKDEEDKRKKEEEEELTRAIEEIELEQEEEELKEREEERRRAETTTLEEIAEETPLQKVEEQREYFTRQPYQTQQQRPVEEIHNVINRSHEVYHNLGRLPEREAYETRKAEEELMHKKQAGYVPPNERAQNMMQRAEEMLDELKDPLKRAQRYKN